MEPEITRSSRVGRALRRSAFTLVEAAVTLMILLMLSAWLLPATAQVSRSSKAGRCLGNLMRIGYANAIYAAQDPAEMAIPVHPAQFMQDPYRPEHIGPYAWGGKSGIGEPASAGEPFSARKGTMNGFGPARRPLNQIIYGDSFTDYTDDPGDDYANWMADTELDLDAHRCPTDSGYTGVHSPAFRDERLTSYDHFGTSYGANMFMSSYAGGGPMTSNSPYLHRMSDIISPATTLAYQENNGRFAWAAAPEQCDFIQPGIPGTARGWHGKDWTFNASFIDSHAEAIFMRGYVSVPVFQDQDLQQQRRCIIIRGDGWQKDTLPADPTPTGLSWGGGGGRPSYEDGIE
ncbi:MAG: type II secretion system protein [Planctomycetota bacterium]|jgi:hypothetical protein